MRRALLAVAILAGCSHGGGSSFRSSTSTAPVTSAPSSTPPPSTPAPPPPPPPLMPPQGVWLKGDFHVHSTHSGDATSLGDGIAGVIHCAEYAGLDFTTISDHRVTDCLTDPQFTQAVTPLVLIPGEEWGGPGHAGAHGLTRQPVMHTQDESQGPTVAIQKIQQAISDVHQMGGIFVLNHPIDTKTPWLWPTTEFDAIECWNQSWAFRDAENMTPAMVQSWIAAHGATPPPEVAPAVASAGGMNRQRLVFYEQHLASGRHVAALGGGDAHYFILPGQPTTKVFAAARTQTAILDAVRHCRTQVQRSPGAPDLEFTADRDGDGIFESIVGERIPLQQAPITFKIHVKRAKDGKLELVKNGQVAQRWTIATDDFEVTWKDAPTSKSWYRVNCWEKLDLSFPNAGLLRTAVLGSSQFPFLPILQSLGGVFATIANDIQMVLDTGGPAVLWLLLNGGQVGVSVAPLGTTYPRLNLPDSVNKVFNVAVDDPDYCASVLTSPIWVE